MPRPKKPGVRELKRMAKEEERLAKIAEEAAARAAEEKAKHEPVRRHNCTICKSEHRDEIERWRDQDGLTLRQLQQKMIDVLGMKVSKDMLARHFKFREVRMDAVRELTAEGIARKEATTAMQVFVDNYGKASKMLETLTDEEGHLLEAKNATYASLLLRERRESALALLRFTPEDPDGKVAEAAQDWVSLMREAQKQGGNLPPNTALPAVNPIDAEFTVAEEEEEERGQ